MELRTIRPRGAPLSPERSGRACIRSRSSNEFVRLRHLPLFKFAPHGLALALVVLVTACARVPEAVDISDELNGPVSPFLTIPFDKYQLTPEGLLRTYSISGDRNGTDRVMVKTVTGNYLSRNFRFELSVYFPEGHEDLAYIGFGEGTPN